MSISVDELAAAVMKELETYSQEAELATRRVVKDVAEECRQNIMNGAPSGSGENSGKYKRSWKKKLAYSSATQERYVIYSSRYQLTHLLEHGHEKWLWGEYTAETVKGKPHIRPAEARAEEKLISAIKKELST